MKLIDTKLSRFLLPAKGRKQPTAGPKLAKSRGHAGFWEFAYGWRAWIAENLALKADQEQVLRDLMNQDFQTGEVQREIEKAFRSPNLIDAQRYAKTHDPWRNSELAHIPRSLASTEHVAAGAG